MKRLIEGKTACKILRTPRKIFFITFLTANISAQTFINNFCYYKKFESVPGFQKIYMTDYSEDNIPDLLLINGVKKKVVEYKSNLKDIFENKVEKFFFYTITDLNKLLYKPGSGDLYLFLSRKERLAGLVSFTKHGTIQLLNKIALDSYPDKSIMGDVNNDGKKEAIVFGSNYRGLTLVYEDNFVLKTDEIIPDKSYSEATFINLDYDDYEDLVCYDYLKGRFDFLYNEDAGVFYENRQIDFHLDVKNLTAMDFNRDGYDDLLFQTDRQVNFFFGDSVSSFENRKVITSKEKLIDYATGDFNRDNLTDIAYITDSGCLFVSFAITNDSLAAPLLFMKKDNLVDLYSYRLAKKAYLLALSSSGQLYTLSGNYDKNDFSITAGVEPGALNHFDYSDSYNNDLVFIDDFDNKVKFLLRGNAGGFEKYFEVPVERAFENIIVSENQKPLTTFFCYSKGGKLVERIEFDFSNGTYKKNKIYSREKISDLKVTDNKVSQNVYALLYNKKTALIKNYSFEKNSVTINQSDTLIGSVFAPVFSSGFPSQIYYWSKSDTEIKYNFLNSPKDEESNVVRVFKADSSFKNTFVNRSLKLDKLKRYFSVGYAPLTGKPFVYLSNGLDFTRINFEGKNIPVIKNERALYYYKSYLPEFESVFCYDETSSTLLSADLESDTKNKLLNGLFKNIYIKNYFVTDLFLNQVNLVYSDPVENCITIRRIE